MKRWIVLLLAMLLALSPAAALAERETLETTDYLAAQAQVDAALIAEGEAGYSFEEPLVVLNPYGNAPLSAVAVFSTREETGGTVTAKGKAPEDNISGSFPAAKTHFVPVYGLYAGGVTEVEFKLDDGRVSTVEIETEPLDLGLANFAVNMRDAARYDYEKLTICANMILRCYAGYDSKGDLRWALTDTGANAITLLENGRFAIPNVHGHGAEFPNGLTGVREVDPLGKVYNVYVWNGGEHHEIIEMPGGNLMAASSMPGYVTDRDYIAEIDPASGEVVWELDMSEVIAPGSSGGVEDAGRDWCHMNALAYDEASDALLISCRHLEAVVAVRRETKELLWILGDPSGWDEAYAPYLLEPIGENFGWPYGQHQLTLLSNGDLLLFDNGEYGRAKAPDQDRAVAVEDNYSRAVIYRLDVENGTVEQIWEYGRALGASHYAGSMSGVQLLDEASESYLVDFGTCESERGTETYIHYIVGDEPIWEMNYTGSSTYRAYRYALYQDAAYDPRAKGNWLGDLGETVALEGVEMDAEGARTMPEGVRIEYYPFGALRVAGAFAPEGGEAPERCALVLVQGDGVQRAYDVAYTVSKGADGTLVRPSRWISTTPLPEGEYALYLWIDGESFDTGLSLNL